MATSRGAYGTVAARPYVLTWRGNLTVLAGEHGEVGAYASIGAAIKAGRRHRDQCRLWSRAHQPWFVWAIVDRRTGEIITQIT